MSFEEALCVLTEHKRYMDAAAEYYFTPEYPPYPIEKVREALRVFNQ